jgi:peptide chain release factor 1
MEAKIAKLLDRLNDIEKQLGDEAIFQNQQLYKELTQEHSYLNGLKEAYSLYQKLNQELIESKNLLVSETNPDMVIIIKEEIASLEKELFLAKRNLESILVPPDPRDSQNILLEVRAGTGGEEAALFVADMVRMYQNYAGRKNWRLEVLSTSPSDLGGYKEYIMAFSGHNVHRLLQYEAGTHRVQRVPKTEAQGRVHTSAVTVAVLVEPNENEKIQINDKDLQIDTYRASGAGGQHVNTTDSAVRITHKPTGVVVTCQDERSQHKNKEKAMRLLSARLSEALIQQKHQEMSSLRSSQVGSGDRSERIRTYNFPQNRLTDHRIDLTLYKLDLVMEGDLDDITEPLVAYFYQQKLVN